MMRRLLINLLVTIFLPISTAQAVTKISASFSHSFEDYKNFEYTDSKNPEDNFKTISFNVTHFFNNGLNISASSNRLINHKSKREAMQSGVQFRYDHQSFIDSLSIGYKVNRVNTSLVLANVNLKSVSYNEYFYRKSKISAIVPAINISYAAYKAGDIVAVPSLTFYKSNELGITKAVMANINFMF